MNPDTLFQKTDVYPAHTYIVISIVSAVILSAFLFSGCSLFDTNNSKSEIKEVPFEILRQASAGQSTTGVPPPVSKCSFNYSNIDLPDQEVPASELSGLELVITDQENFEHYLRCNEDAVEVNLDTDFILAGMTTGQPHGIYIEDQSVIFTGDTLQYNVEVWKLVTTQPDRAHYVVLVPDAYRDYPVDFNIYWREEQ